jgi:glycosyltransferase involved in cell wall biosynthesis
MDEKLKLAFIIPTKGRQKKLNILLDSLKKQVTKPDLIIILDSGEEPLFDRIKPDGLALKYIHTEPNSLTQARNIGIKNIPTDYHLTGFLDDDVILYPDALDKMKNFFHGASSNIAGVSFNVTNSRNARKLWFLKKIFFLGDSRPGNIMSSGYPTALENIKKDVYTRWLPGGATVWRTDVFKEFMFDENFKGYGCMEDIDFSYRVGRKYKLICLAEARLFHEPHPINREQSFCLGYSEIVNWHYFINKFNDFSRKLFYLAALGRLFENFTCGILSANSAHLIKAMGNFAGFQNLIFKKRNLLKDEK